MINKSINTYFNFGLTKIQIENFSLNVFLVNFAQHAFDQFSEWGWSNSKVSHLNEYFNVWARLQI